MVHSSLGSSRTHYQLLKRYAIVRTGRSLSELMGVIVRSELL